ncbi:MAG: serine/threonine protein kinase [Planctomycetales bacterium]|nr:serine/threonine protein kinase [Planctomycetales bacterium]
MPADSPLPVGEVNCGHGSNDAWNEAKLANLVSTLADRMQAGESFDLIELCRQHPLYAEDLREVWGAIVVTDAIGGAVRDSTLHSDKSASKFEYGIAISQFPYAIGDYELLDVIGRGGMGVVYRARQRTLNRVVAVKMIHDNCPSSPENRQRFFAEAKATARLEHPGIVPIFEVSEFQGHPFFSMQYVPGENLAQVLKRGPVPQRIAAEQMVDVCRAIDFAHSQGVVHRDIKPSNILQLPDGRVRVTDFGLAKLADSADSLTRSGAVVGTPSYMSPEQASGHTSQLGPRSDIYSLGTVLYHLLTGRPPFIADTPIELALQILEHDPPPPRLLEPRIDRDLDMIVQRAIQKPPDLRYATAGEMADDLECFLRDEPVRARSGKLSQIVARWFRETHHAPVLENWGLLWMWHSLVLLVVCMATEWMRLNSVQSRVSYSALWVVGLGTWAAVFWALRRRMGPVTFVERQIAHVWGASLIAIAALTPLEWLLDLEPLKLSPILAVVGSIVFFVKAGILEGWFYIQAACLLATSFLMALFPNYAQTLFGFVAATCFFVPGLKYFRRKIKGQR